MSSQLDALLSTVEALRGPGDWLSRVERFLWLAIETGARKSAIIELQWRSVDFQRGLIDFSNAKMGNTYKRRAMVPISNRLRPTLDRAFQERSPATNTLVLDHLGCLRKPFARVTTAAGLPWVTTHRGSVYWGTDEGRAREVAREVATKLREHQGPLAEGRHVNDLVREAEAQKRQAAIIERRNHRRRPAIGRRGDRVRTRTHSFGRRLTAIRSAT